MLSSEFVQKLSSPKEMVSKKKKCLYFEKVFNIFVSKTKRSLKKKGLCFDFELYFVAELMLSKSFCRTLYLSRNTDYRG